MTMKITYMNCHLSEITELDKNDHSRRKFQMALKRLLHLNSSNVLKSWTWFRICEQKQAKHSSFVLLWLKSKFFLFKCSRKGKTRSPKFNQMNTHLCRCTWLDYNTGRENLVHTHMLH